MVKTLDIKLNGKIVDRIKITQPIIIMRHNRDKISDKSLQQIAQAAIYHNSLKQMGDRPEYNDEYWGGKEKY